MKQCQNCHKKTNDIRMVHGPSWDLKLIPVCFDCCKERGIDFNEIDPCDKQNK